MYDTLLPSHADPACSTPLPQPEEVATLIKAQGQELLLSQASRRGAPAKISWTVLCLGVVVCVLMGWPSQLALWRLLCFEGFWGWLPGPVLSDQAIYNRLQRAAPFMQQLFEQLSRRLRERLLPWQDRRLAPFATQVLLLDECVLGTIGRWLPRLRALARHDPRLLAGRISALFDVRLQQWVRVEMLPGGTTNCKVHAPEMLRGLAQGTLLLFDRGYFSFVWLDLLARRGVWWVTRYSHHASWRLLHVNYQGDGVFDAIVRLGVHRSEQTAFPVRLLEYTSHGVVHRYLTNVYDPALLPLAMVVKLYAKRWDIELAFRLLKDFLHLNVLWCAKWSVIQVQLWAGLLLAQYLHGLQHEIAVRAGVEPEEVSMDLLVRLSARGLTIPVNPVDVALTWGREAGVIRPSGRITMEVPFVDPAWVTPPPEEVLRPRKHARTARRGAHSKEQRFRKKLSQCGGP